MSSVLNNKTAVICGGSGSLGKAMAIRFVSEGCKVLLCGRSKEKLSVAQNLILNQYPLGEIKTFSADISDPEESQAIFGYAMRALGKVDILVNSLPITFTQIDKFSNVEDYIWAEKFKEKFLSYSRMTQLFLPSMKLHQYGRIIQVAGLTGKEPSRDPEGNLFIAGVMNAAIINFSKSLSLECASENISINVINPGFMLSERLDHYIHHLSSTRQCSTEKLKEEIKLSIPARRFGMPEEIANLAVFLASNQSSYITGQSISVDGGYSRSMC